MINDQAADKLEPDPFHMGPDPVQVVGLTIKEAAAELGISEKTVRHRIKLNHLAALKVETPQGYQWRVYPDGLPLGRQVEPDPLPAERETEEDLEPDPVQLETPALLEVLHMLDARQAMIDRLQQEASEKAERIAELTGAAAHWQTRAIVAEEQARRAEEQVRLLMAPKDEPVEPEPSAAAEPRRSWWRRLWSG